MRLSKRAALFLVRQHRALALLRTAQAAPDFLHAFGVRLVERDEVVVGQLVAGLDVAANPA